jgi:short-subunit dehydrogenase
MKDNVVIITGASSGIGFALANELAKRGATLSLAARNSEKLEEMVKDYHERGIRAIAVPTDVSKEEDCRNLVQQTVEAFGRIDVLINNAGISMRALFEDVDLKVLHRLMDVNFWGAVYCTKYALPYLLQTRGSIVGVISVAGHIGFPGRTGYAASKFAMRGFLDTIRCENQKKGLHVLVVTPGFTGTNIRNLSLTADGTPQGKTPRDEGRMMTAEDVARKIIRAIGKRKRSLILTFMEGKLTVFLNKFFPSLVDRLAYNHLAKEPDSPFN